ncbi:hypothetical protein E2I00_011035 [Balaenoptera physalus]|uniref:Uncharacterized protein n=1 Tax=Balaenoptera physalus TaxID=9770 RepID=A0A643CC15_BALPH|nr:hypothetical protein E2I00_011035 [Balaenoptera physalus]
MLLKYDNVKISPCVFTCVSSPKDLQNVFSAEVLPETEDKSRLSTNTRKTPKAEEVVASESFSEIPIHKGWVLDGFPMTLNQAKLLEEALTGCNRNLIELEGKKSQISTLAVDPTTSREVPLPPSAFDFVMLLDISDNSSLNRMNDIMAEAFSSETPHEDINQRVAAKNQDVDEDQNLRDQIQHRIVGFLDNWPLLEQWFTEPENILIKINAAIDKQSLCQKVKEMFMTEIMKKENKVKKKLEEKEAEEKEGVSPTEATSPLPPPPPPPEPEKEKEVHPQRERSKTPAAKGKPASGFEQLQSYESKLSAQMKRKSSSH